MALFVRIMWLSDLPYGFHVDEAKVAWNAKSILMTGKDDRGGYLPLYYNSFGDFRPAGLIYLVVPFVKFLGVNVFSVRLPFAILGALTVWPLFLLIKVFLGSVKSNVPIFGALMLALNPWHIVVSRSTSELIPAVFLTLWGLYFLKVYLDSGSKIKLFVAFASIVISYFFYHSIRLLAPIFVLFVLWESALNGVSILKRKLGVFVLVLLIVLTGALSIDKKAKARFEQVSILSDFRITYEIARMPVEEGPGKVFQARAFHNRIASYLRVFAEEYAKYFGTDFLIGNSSRPVRYTVPYVGLMTYFELVLLVCGLMNWHSRRKLVIFFWMVLISPLPAAMTNEDSPNLMRSFFSVPFIIIIMSSGLDWLMSQKQKLIPFFFSIGYFVNFGYFFHMYCVHQRMSIASYYRNGGAIDLANKLKSISATYSKVVLTNSPDDLYPWMAMVEDFDPSEFNSSLLNRENGHLFNRYLFSTSKCPSSEAVVHKEVENDVLYVDAEGCSDKSEDNNYQIKTVDDVTRPDGSKPFLLRKVTVKNVLTNK